MSYNSQQPCMKCKHHNDYVDECSDGSFHHDGCVCVCDDAYTIHIKKCQGEGMGDNDNAPKCPLFELDADIWS